MKKISQASAKGQRMSVSILVIALVLIAGALYVWNERAVRAQHLATTETTSLIARSVTDTDHILGEKDAPIQLIVYSDFSCPFCKQFFEDTLPRLQAAYGSRIVVVFRHLPLQGIHPRAFREAEASECVAKLSGEPAFWSFARSIYAQPSYEMGLSDAQLAALAVNMGLDGDAFTACLADGGMAERIRADMTEAAIAGISFTPSTVYKSAHRAGVLRGAYYPRYVTAIDYLISVESHIDAR